MIERLCERCGKPVKGRLFRNLCRSCYDKNRKTTVVSIPKKLEPLFVEYAGERDDTARCIIELVELGLQTWKYGKVARIIYMES